MSAKPLVLYIDQDAASRMLIDRTLRYSGYRVKTAERGLDGLDYARTNPFDLILTDIALPDITGRELTTVLRSDPRFADVPIVALTDLHFSEQRDLAMAAGLTGYITKPLDVEYLPEQISYYLEGGRDTIDEERMSVARSRYSREVVTNLEGKVRELEGRNRDLVRLDSMKDSFLQITAHELRTPLTLVFGYMRLLQEHEEIKAIAEKDANTGDLIKGLVDGIDRMQSIINEILVMSRIMTGEIKLSLGPVGLRDLFGTLKTTYTDALAERKITLEVDVESLPRTIRADAEMVKTLFDNLLSNAIKFTPDGGSIRVHGRTNDAYVFVHVTDSGVGVDAEQLQSIFERFQTTHDPALHSTSKTNFGGGGLGLGLPISQGIAQEHGGEIHVESEGHDPEKTPGATFIVKLPLSAQFKTVATDGNATKTS